MPEYLSPGVYVEEFEMGAKPIEGVSTSTAGFLGMTERGPINKPLLIDSFGKYQSVFGGYLTDAYKVDTDIELKWMPYAVEAFFQNGGKRVFVTRVLDVKTAKESSGFVPDISGLTTALNEDVRPRAITIKVDSSANLNTGDILMVKDDTQSEFCKINNTVKRLITMPPIAETYPKGTEINKLKKGDKDYKLDEEVKAGASEFTLDGVDEISANDALVVKDDVNSEIFIVDSVDVPGKKITVKSPLTKLYAKDTAINRLVPADPPAKGTLLFAPKAGSNALAIDKADDKFSVDDLIGIDGEYLKISSVDADNIILLEQELKYEHKNGMSVKKLVPALEVTAVSKGTWGDGIKITVKDSSISKAKLTADAPAGQTFLELTSVNGMEKGTLIRVPKDSANFYKVTEVIKNLDTKKVTLEKQLDTPVNKGEEVVTAEFTLTISCQGEEEIFKNVSFADTHSRYVSTVINGVSGLVKVEVKSAGALPMPTEDKEPGWRLTGGNDGRPADENGVITIFKGKDSEEPAERKGIYSLKNVDGISIVAMPGITLQPLQNEVISHCENMKDRFGVLDPIKGSQLDGIQEQRNLYDSKYAAIYYPWVTIFDNVTGKNIQAPPSGCVTGVYARTDIERGVHKAPANEKLNGVVGLECVVTKGQQDILNPLGVNCIRIFPGRGIRVWGARTISSDSLWKYVNVRRLFIKLEKSIDNATQWVVFEPNDVPLWARVRQSISQYLTDEWRGGALAGNTPEEAFFVKCDRTTMSQGDIDNGRLICVIGVAPVKPAEFVIFRIAQWTAGAKS